MLLSDSTRRSVDLRAISRDFPAFVLGEKGTLTFSRTSVNEIGNSDFVNQSSKVERSIDPDIDTLI